MGWARTTASFSSTPNPGRSGTSIAPSANRSGGDSTSRAPRRLAPLKLQQAEVLQHGARLHRGGRAHRSARVVRRHGHAVGVGHRGNAGQLQQAAAVLHVGHDDVHGPGAAERREAGDAEQHLAAGHGLADGARGSPACRRAAPAPPAPRTRPAPPARAALATRVGERARRRSCGSPPSARRPGRRPSRMARVAAMPACTAASMRSAGEPAGGKPSHGAAFTRLESFARRPRRGRGESLRRCAGSSRD